MTAYVIPSFRSQNGIAVIQDRSVGVRERDAAKGKKKRKEKETISQLKLGITIARILDENFLLVTAVRWLIN